MMLNAFLPFIGLLIRNDFGVIFTENGHNRNTLNNIATEYLRNINKPKSNDQSNTKNTKNKITIGNNS